MSMPDHIGALVTFLKANSALNTLVGGRIFGGSLPAAQTQHMPRKAVVLTASGGGQWLNASYAQATERRIDVRCFGENEAQADAVHRHVWPLLKGMTREQVGEAVLFSTTPYTSGFNLIEPSTDWPFVLCYYGVKVSEVAVTS